MGIVNVTPDSFSDGGRYANVEAAIDAGMAMHAHGADIIDVGGESTRPGATPVPLALELERTIPVIRGLAGRGVPVSVDTMKAEVMRRALQAGATMLNDVSALCFDCESLEVAAASDADIVLMHMLGEPRTMQHMPQYKDVLAEVLDFLGARIVACEAAGIPRSRLIVDPGIGFGKTADHHLILLRNLEAFHALGVRILLGASRKSVIGSVVGPVPVEQRLPGSLALALRGAAAGVHWVRVHDVAETVQALRLWSAISSPPCGGAQRGNDLPPRATAD